MTKGILFNTKMVQAILDGQKKTTRRVMNPQPIHEGGFWKVYGAGWVDSIPEVTPVYGHSLYENAPYKPGDILYVRETWSFLPCMDCPNYIDSLNNAGDCDPVEYEDRHMIAEGCYLYKESVLEPERVQWRPSIHMPKKAARIWLRVLDVKVEQLQNISGGGLMDEGIDIHKSWYMRDAFSEFRELWNSTIKPKDRELYEWSANPWVWVISFERCEKPEE